jgi:hypothetical protein
MQAFDPDLILLNMLTVADAAGVVIVTGCKNLYKSFVRLWGCHA